MIISLLILNFLLIFLLICLRNSKKINIWIILESFLLTSVIFGVILIILIQLLSIFNLLSYNWIVLGWVIALISEFTLIYKFRRNNFKIQFIIPKLNSFEMILLLIVVLILAVLLLIALVSPPNNYDSLVYHIARVPNWILNHNIRPYATVVDRQLYQPPFAEYIILNLQILTGSDLFANSVQWFAFLNSIIASVLIIRKLGGNRKALFIGIIMASTLPMAILQSSSTQNDVVMSMTFLTFIYFLLKLKSDLSFKNALLVGITVALALLTKGTSYIYLLPFCIWFGCTQINKINLKLIKILALILIPVTILTSGYFLNNFYVYKDPFGTSAVEGTWYPNEHFFSLRTLEANLIRNITLHLVTPSNKINKIIYDLVNKSSTKLGINLNSRSNTFYTTQFDKTIFDANYYTNEDTAGNLVTFILIVLSLFFLPFIRVKKKKEIIMYALLVGVGVILFCMYLKWQPWNSRLHTPIFFAIIPVSSIILSNLNKFFRFFIIILLIISSLPFLFKNKTRPLFPYSDSILNSNSDTMLFNSAGISLLPSYKMATNFSKDNNCKAIGIIFYGNDIEYPIWKFLGNETASQYLIKHVNVSGSPSKTLEDLNFHPDCIISSYLTSNTIKVHNLVYTQAKSDPNISVYIRGI